MLELPEIARIATQADSALRGRKIARVTRGTSPHKWFFFDKSEEEMAEALTGRQVRGAVADAKCLHLLIEGDRVLTFNEMGGQIRLFEKDSDLPKNYHFSMTFEDGASFTAMVQGWGFCGLSDRTATDVEHSAHQCLNPLLDSWTSERFVERVRTWPEHGKKPVKALMVGRHAVEGLGNGYLHDVLFLAGILPMRKLTNTSDDELRVLHDAVREVLREATDCGGRDVERDLFGQPGGYRPILDKRKQDEPCPKCGTPITKMAYLGGSSYFCKTCQR